MGKDYPSLADFSTADLERFWSKVSKGADEACWTWTAAKDPKGYGAFSFRGVRYKTHRLSFALFVGPLTPGLFVCHRCDNPPCVNPAHLWEGTVQENQADCLAKGRYARGEDLPGSRLEATKIREIKDFYYNGQYSIVELATRYGVAQGTVSSVVYGVSWTELFTEDDRRRLRAMPRRRTDPALAAAIIELWASGVSQAETARRLGIKLCRVFKAVERYRRARSEREKEGTDA